MSRQYVNYCCFFGGAARIAPPLSFLGSGGNSLAFFVSGGSGIGSGRNLPGSIGLPDLELGGGVGSGLVAVGGMPGADGDGSGFERSGLAFVVVFVGIGAGCAGGAGA